MTFNSECPHIGLGLVTPWPVLLAYLKTDTHWGSIQLQNHVFGLNLEENQVNIFVATVKKVYISDHSTRIKSVR